jgi:hypothetical protein
LIELPAKSLLAAGGERSVAALKARTRRGMAFGAAYFAF